MGVTEGVKPTDQILLGIAIGQCPFSDRRDNREGILDPVAEFGGEHLLLLLGRDKAGNVDKC